MVDDIYTYRLPQSDRGYSVDPLTGTVHMRYQDHASSARRTSERGAYNMLGDRKPVVCDICWPPPPVKATTTVRPSRRSRNRAEAPTTDTPEPTTQTAGPDFTASTTPPEIEATSE
jgi:hypothetical protein